MWHGLPGTFDPGRVQPVAPYQLHPLRRDVLSEFRQEITGIEPWSELSAPARVGFLHMHVFLEILVVMGVKEHTAFKPFIVDLLQGDSSPLYGVELVFSLREKPEEAAPDTGQGSPGISHRESERCCLWLVALLGIAARPCNLTEA